MQNLCSASIALLIMLIASPAYAKESNTSPAPRVNQASEALPEFSTPVTKEEIRQAFYRYSVVSIVKKLHENNAANWNMILDKIAAGDEEWISYTVSYIRPGTDAAATSELIASLAFGLSNNPEAVLTLEAGGQGVSMYYVCTAPFYSPSYEFLRDYGEKTLTALHEVDKPYLLDSRDTCIRRLQEILGRSERDHEEGRWSPE